MNESELLNILSDWNYWGSFHEQPLARPDYLARVEKRHSKKTATVLLGVRRAGKSSLIYLFINQEIKKGRFQTKDTLIVNFEDTRFYLPLSGDDLFKIYAVHLKHPDPSLPLVVLDEVQNVQGWEKFVRYLKEVGVCRQSASP